MRWNIMIATHELHVAMATIGSIQFIAMNNPNIINYNNII